MTDFNIMTFTILIILGTKIDCYLMRVVIKLVYVGACLKLSEQFTKHLRKTLRRSEFHYEQ